MDALSEVLRAVRLSGATILNADFGAPWAVSVGSTAALAKGFLPEADAPAVFHLVVAGECVLQAEAADAIALRAGDLVLLAHGSSHRIGDAVDSKEVPLASLLRPSIAGELVTVVHGGDGTRTRLVTGLIAIDRSLADPLFAALPATLRVNLAGAPAAEHLRDALGFELSGSEAPRAGGIASLARLAELVFIEAIRRHVESIPPGDSGWLAGLGDRYVGRALALLHARPGEDWTVERLARQVGLSRSALAERFTELLAEPPITYLTSWRLRLAALALKESSRSIATLAREAGYESANAFSHAFKRAFGTPPTLWRRGVRRRPRARRKSASAAPA